MNVKSMANTSEEGVGLPVLYDRFLLLAVMAIIAIGLLMVTSSSIVIANRLYGDSFHYLIRQLIHLGIGFVLAGIVLRVEVARWQQYSAVMLLISLALLVIVLIPGIGRQVNGSTRWIGIGPVGIQASEVMKLVIIVYMASYLVRHAQQVRTQLIGFIKPLALIAIIAVLLLKEPDFGAATVIIVTVMGMLFLAGVRLWQFAMFLTAVVAALAMLAVSSPYRLQRLTTFLNPWANQFDSGYQLTQSLIAFGRGGWLGVGLGESIQKLFYLPEAHTDFLFAVLAEELGLIGVLGVMLLFAIIVMRGFNIGRQAQQYGKPFACYVAYGLSLWLSLQVMINIGVNSGVLPTKGLTLPLMSYGGGSMLVNCVAIALLLRIDYEVRMAKFGLSSSSSDDED